MLNCFKDLSELFSKNSFSASESSSPSLPRAPMISSFCCVKRIGSSFPTFRKWLSCTEIRKLNAILPSDLSLCLSIVVSRHPAASLQTVLWSQVSWKPGNWKLSLGTLSTDKLFVQRTWTGQWTQYASFYLVPDRNNSFYLGDSGLHCQLHGVEGVNQPQVARAESLQGSLKFSNLTFTDGTGFCCHNSLNSQQCSVQCTHRISVLYSF